MTALTLWAFMAGYRVKFCTFVRQVITSTVKMGDRCYWACRLIAYNFTRPQFVGASKFVMQDEEYFTNHKILLNFQEILHIFFKKKIMYERSVLSLIQPSSNSYGCPKSRQNNKIPKQISSYYFLQMLERQIHRYLLYGIYGMSC